MNNIITEPQPHDALNHARKSDATIAGDLLHTLVTSVPYDCTFVSLDIPGGLTRDQCRALTAALKKKFELWANSNLAPGLRRIKYRARNRRPANKKP